MAERTAARAIILNEENKVLIGLRNKNDRFGNLWNLIGGKPNTNEWCKVAVKREVREELGVKLLNVRFYLMHRDTTTDPNNPWTTYF